MAAERHSCAKRVYTGARWDFGGHMCGIAAKVERDGKWWCGRHDPEKVAAKNAAKDAAQAVARKARDERESRLTALANEFENITGVTPILWRRDSIYGYPAPLLGLGIYEADLLVIMQQLSDFDGG